MSDPFPRTGFAIEILDGTEDHADVFTVTEGHHVYRYTVHNVDRSTALLIGLIRGTASVFDLSTGDNVQVLHFSTELVSA